MQKKTTDKMVITGTRIAGVLLLAGLIVWGSTLLWDMLKYEQTNDAQVEEYVNPVNTRVGGYIQKVCFQENQPVNAGDTLVIIDNSEYLIRQQEAAAALENASSQIHILEAGENTLRSSAAINASQAEAARARMNRQQQEYTRYKNLLGEESTTQQQFDNVKTALDIATAEYRSMEHAWQAALLKIADVEAQKKAALSEIKRRKYVVGRNELELKYTIVTAPYKGRIGRRNIQDGQLVQPGQTLAFIINDNAGKWIVANFKETQISHFRRGQPVTVTVDAFPAERFAGEIESVSPATGSRFSLLPPDNATGNFVKIIQRIPVRIKLTDDHRKISLLSAGMNANVSINK